MEAYSWTFWFELYGLKDREQTDGWWREEGRGWARWVMGIKEGPCCDDHWVFYVSDEPLNSTQETNTGYTVNYVN